MTRTVLLLSTLVFGACVAPASPAEQAGGTALYRESVAAYSKGDLETAETGFIEVIARVPSHAEAWFRLGNVYARTNRQVEAVEAYQKAVSYNPQNSRAWHNMGVIQLRQSANSFMSLAQHTVSDDPLRDRAQTTASEIFDILQESRPEIPSDEQVAADPPGEAAVEGEAPEGAADESPELPTADPAGGSDVRAVAP
jgi:tetratricopeptide (TPR) repeat protein